MPNFQGQDIQGAFGFHPAELLCVGLCIPDCDLRTSNIASRLPWTARFGVLKKKTKQQPSTVSNIFCCLQFYDSTFGLHLMKTAILEMLPLHLVSIY